MILFTLLRHDWLKTFRARGFYKNLAVNILLGFVVLYFIAIFFALGLFLQEFLKDTAITDKTPLQVFNGITLYILLAGLAVRYMMQQLATINIQIYQILPIKRTSIINYLLFTPLLSPINYILFFTIIPFAVRSVSVDYNALTAFGFILNFFFIVCFNSLITSFIKRKFGSNFWGFFAVLAFFGIIIALEYFKIFSLFNVSGVIFDYIILNPTGLAIPFIAIVLAYLLNRWFFAQKYYAESFGKKAKTETHQNRSNLSFLNRFGVIGEIMALEMRLVWRHKRTKNLLYLLVLFLLYGLIFYTNADYANRYGFLFFCAMIMTGAVTLLFGQWLIGWNSSHFDSLMTINFPIRSYLIAHFYLMLAGNILCFILTLPYFLFGTHIAMLHISAFLFNSGVNTVLLTFFATYNTKRIDLAAKSALNYQGTTYKNFLIVFPIMFFPMIFVGIFSLFSAINTALIILSVMGVIGLLFQKQLITLCVNQFNRRKYALCEGFRQTE
ncbi:MAG: DUF5687 family protein [Lentimicrobiaceae bacterium]|nr:DUF5687 family protein [Lentimicrobiaceae bacterium]